MTGGKRGEKINRIETSCPIPEEHSLLETSWHLWVPSPPMTYNWEISCFCKNPIITFKSKPPLEEARIVPLGQVIYIVKMKLKP